MWTPWTHIEPIRLTDPYQSHKGTPYVVCGVSNKSVFRDDEVASERIISMSFPHGTLATSDSIASRRPGAKFESCKLPTPSRCVKLRRIRLFHASNLHRDLKSPSSLSPVNDPRLGCIMDRAIIFVPELGLTRTHSHSLDRP